MATVISGTTGCSQVQAGSINQDDLAANVVGKGPAFSAYATVNQNLAASNTFYKIEFGGEEFDTNDNFSGSKFTPTVAGYYEVKVMLALSATGASNAQAVLYKNGTSAKFLGVNGSGGAVGGSALVYMNGTTDYIEVYGKITGSAAWVVSAGVIGTYFSAFLVRAA